MRVRGERHIKQDRIATLAALIMSLAWISCTPRDDEFDNNKVTIIPVVQNRIETVIQTRALAGYHEFDQPGQHLTAYAIAFSNNHVNRLVQKDVRGRSFTYTGSAWRSSLEVEKNYSYNVYAHSPLPGATIDTLVYSSETNVTLEFSGLNVITDTDPLISTEAAGSTEGTEPTFTEHNFQIGNISAVSGENGATKVFLKMDHLYAKATLSFSIDSAYNDLRTIRIKSVDVITQNNGKVMGNHVISFTGNLLTLASSGSGYSYGGSPIPIDIMNGRTASDNLFDKDNQGNDLEYVTLTKAKKEFGWFCFLSDIKPVCNMTVTYDVLDKKGNKLSTRTATNKNILGKVSSAARGYNYKIAIIVKPTYLYQLSDDDVEFELEIE